MRLLNFLTQLWPRSFKAAGVELAMFASIFVFLEAMNTASGVAMTGGSFSASLIMRLIVGFVVGVVAAVAFTYLQAEARSDRTGVQLEVETLAKAGRNPGAPVVASRSDDPAPGSSPGKRPEQL